MAGHRTPCHLAGPCMGVGHCRAVWGLQGQPGGEQHLPQDRGTDAGRSARSPGSLWGGGADVEMVLGAQWLSARVPPQGSEHRRQQQRQQRNLVSRPLWHKYHPSPQQGAAPSPPSPARECWLCPRVPASLTVLSPAAGAGVLPGVGGIPGVAPGVGVGGVPGVGGEAMRGLCPGALLPLSHILILSRYPGSWRTGSSGKGSGKGRSFW